MLWCDHDLCPRWWQLKGMSLVKKPSLLLGVTRFRPNKTVSLSSTYAPVIWAMELLPEELVHGVRGPEGYKRGARLPSLWAVFLLVCLKEKSVFILSVTSSGPNFMSQIRGTKSHQIACCKEWTPGFLHLERCVNNLVIFLDWHWQRYNEADYALREWMQSERDWEGVFHYLRSCAQAPPAFEEWSH